MTEAEALNRFRERVTYGFNQSDLAKEFGVSRSFMSAVLSGQKKMTQTMLASLGLRRVTKIKHTIEETSNAPDQS